MASPLTGEGSPSEQNAFGEKVHRTRGTSGLAGLVRPGVPGVLALGLIAACLIVDRSMLRVGLDELDEGYFADQATRVLHGQLPYRDFENLYTPGLVYLHAWLFGVLGGPSLIGMRLASLAARAGVGVGMYVLGRQLLSPLWAALPALFLLVGLDTIPAGWEPHPGWYSTVFAIACVWLLAQVPSARRRWPWLVGAGVAAGVSYVFKQNTGAFLAIGAVDFLLLQGADVPRRPVTLGLRAVQWLAAIGTLAIVGWLMHAYLDVAVALLIAGPLLAAGVVLLRRDTVAERVSPHARGDAAEGVRQPVAGGASVDAVDHLRERPDRPRHSVGVGAGAVGVGDRLVLVLPFLVGAIGVTLPWLAVLTLSLGGHVELLGGFVGGVDQAALYAPIELPSATALPGVAIAVLLVAGLGPRSSRRWRSVIVAAISCLVVLSVWLTRVADEPVVASVLLMPQRAGVGLATLLPAMGGLGAAWLCRRAVRDAHDWRVRWYLVAGAVTLLTQYPRMDTVHLAWSAPILLVVGALVLARACAFLDTRWQLTRGARGILRGAALFVPLLAALPAVYLRAGVLYEADPDTGWPTDAWLIPLDRPPLVLGFRVAAVANFQLTDLLDYLRTSTVEGDPVFVYPSEPLVYVLANRPNPTPFSHIYPGISPRDVQLLIQDLEAAHVRTVVVSDAWLGFWDFGGGTQPIDDYFKAQFAEVARFGVYRVLERQPSARDWQSRAPRQGWVHFAGEI